MNKRTIKTAAWMLIPALILGFTACKKKTTDEEPAKTLNKTTLMNVLWQNKGGSIKHEFKANGLYRFDGTWNWVNNSDTMEISSSSGEPKLKWKFNYNTEHEMSCEKIGPGGSLLYKDMAW